jgi:predicted nucleotidyltransferase component of viral defense system
MPYSHRQQREIFHFLFLERLLKIADPRLFVLKGGVNLRFFFNSPRYSEDMDLDVLGGSVATLRKNGYRILEDPAFARSLAAFDVRELIVNDPAKAKQSTTTQRFRARLVTSAGDAHPTKVEFSRRAVAHPFVTETIDPAVARPYRRLAFACQHYPAQSAVLQKVAALVHRAELQARDAFDLYVLWLGGHLSPATVDSIPTKDRRRAIDHLLEFDYRDYRGQVLEYLDPEHVERFGSKTVWNEILETLVDVLNDATS